MLQWMGSPASDLPGHKRRPSFATPLTSDIARHAATASRASPDLTVAEHPWLPSLHNSHPLFQVVLPQQLG